MGDQIIRYNLGGNISYGLLVAEDEVHPLVDGPYNELETTGETIPLADVTLLAPIEVRTIFALGLNYASHVGESKYDFPEIPMLFVKPTTSVIGPGEAIVYPKEAELVHHEAEVCAVIGKQGRRISEDQALDFVLGYTCGNDVSERIIQRAEMAQRALLIGKGFDTFTPLGPVIATGLDATNIDVIARVNGEERQRSNTSDLIFSVAQLVSYISQSITLMPGDVIMTGTPSGVSPIVPGDIVEIEISGAGTLSNPLVAES
ncbi:MAG: fumarylacetoacetate hydrolase family protein [Rhodospirillales bacterium]|jgi:2-keto-4-pentenoate hydratase/2-oxohepta-3-ene-1,7-dioic acid hydratase in catechol pathway